MTEFLTIFRDFGLNGLIIGTLFLIIYWQIKESHAERKTWLDTYKEMSMQTIALQQENNDVLRALQSTISEANARTRRYTGAD